MLTERKHFASVRVYLPETFTFLLQTAEASVVLQK
jgi:uncharacterized linocin/CFP29 family protein